MFKKETAIVLRDFYLVFRNSNFDWCALGVPSVPIRR